MHVDAILETCLYVDDLDAAEKFYCELLGLELVSRQEGRHIFLRCGRQMLLIFDPRQSSRLDGDLPPHGASGPGHLALAVPEDELDGWSARLAAAGVSIERQIEWPQGGKSIYFRDSARNSLEMATPRIWGIDETL